MSTTHLNIGRWNRYAHLCPHAADVPINTVPAIALALAPSIAIDLPARGVTRFRFKKRSDRDKFVAAWRQNGGRNA